jgi:NCS1 family nucleobase:cation symporter-1
VIIYTCVGYQLTLSFPSDYTPKLHLDLGGFEKMKSITEYLPSGQTVKRRFTSLSSWQLAKQKSALTPDHVWTNEDMDPVKIENQTWTLWTWMAYWATDTINLGTWETASAILAVGLSWREAIPAV